MNDVSISTGAPAVTFLGAARSVTGSMHLVESGDRRVLLDCGLFRGERDEARLRNDNFPFDPSTLDAVVLSHSHTDHCGNLPNLVRHGFAGPIYCTPATLALTEIMLLDSARIREDEHRTTAVSGGRDRPRTSPREDARRAIDQLQAVPYDTPTSLGPDVELRLGNAGHILGSATVLLTLANGTGERRLLFTGDLGRRGLPFLPEPAPLPCADTILCESTYGGRRHDDLPTMARKISEIVRNVVARGGKVLIPAFSLGRTQTVVHYLRRWMQEGVLPCLPILVDSPLASQVAEVYDVFADALIDRVHDDAPPADYVSPDNALTASLGREPCIIVASGGMCDSGRIIYHLRHHIDDPRSALVLVSYQAPHSLGARLLEKSPWVHFHGKRWNKWIEVTSMNGFSGHADHDDLLHLLRPLADAERRVCLVHGEQHAAEALASDLKPFGFGKVRIPERAEDVSV